ncbi:alpha/beta hydrolase domain-containing protein [Dietzia sp. B32]|uniref:alpha/beta hydrolase domain-containing protein n=1 Tax=Dietzia sp. B32 TaxID=2915130 RepID=UPI0021ADF2E1|nr:alpha/beta hydrolase domain-containing protein [Dietzia sp. B32]UVE93836.1 hypothetical protein L8M95_09635 [Dietzia sp. B32]
MVEAHRAAELVDGHVAGERAASAVSAPTMLLRDDVDPPCSWSRSRVTWEGCSTQPDSDAIVTWEIAGQAHADAHQSGEQAGLVDCGGAINSGQQVFVVRAALRHLVSWVAGGARPPGAPPVELDDDEVVPRDLGIGRGGVRSPAVEPPVEKLVDSPYPQSVPFCMLLGRTEEVAEEQIRQRWSGRDEYLRAYEEAADRLIAEGFLLADDRAEILADARPERISW